MAELPFETLIEGRCPKTEDRWYPIAIDTYKGLFFNIGDGCENRQALVSNLAYNMQYLEYLEKQMSELHLSSVIYTMCIKSFVITGMSILEGIFVAIVKANGWWKTTCYESVHEVKANEKAFGGDVYVIRTEFLRKCEEHSLPMTMDELIDRLDHHHDALGVHHLVYPQLRRLKNLRNRVHLQKSESQTDHDYNAFNETIHKEMKGILYQVLTAVAGEELSSIYDFLKVPEESTTV